MPRPTSFTPDDLVDRALQQFWAKGFHASSMDDLVTATGVSRHGIYTSFGGKQALFLACFARYQSQVVTPAFARVEAPGATLDSVAAYYEHLIALGEAAGLPGPGCFVANAATETAPSDPDVMAEVARHNDRLRRGFAAALQNTAPGHPPQQVQALAEVLVIFTNGLWTLSRSARDGAVLRASVQTCLRCIADSLEQPPPPRHAPRAPDQGVTP